MKEITQTNLPTTDVQGRPLTPGQRAVFAELFGNLKAEGEKRGKEKESEDKEAEEKEKNKN